AVTILGERLRTAQWVAAGLGAAGVLVIAIGAGTFPWISLVLAGTFGGYGLVKKQVGAKVPALPGLAVETLTLAPAALVLLAMLGLLQYVAPTMQYLTGVFLYHEQMSATRWAGFAVVWVALVVLSTDGYRAAATPRPRRGT